MARFSECFSSTRRATLQPMIYPAILRLLLPLGFHPCALAALVGLALTSTLLADVVEMANGDRISGSVIKLADGVLEVETGYAGVVRIQWSEVRDLQVDQPTQVRYADESLKQTRRIDGPAAASAKQSQGPVAQEIVPADEPESKGKFSGRVNLAAELDRGNSISDEYDADFSLIYRRGLNRYEAMGQLEYDSDEFQNTKRDWLLVGKYDRFINERDYISAWYGAKQERLAGLRLRQFAGPGIGREFLSEENHRLAAELTLFAVHEDYVNVPDNQFFGPGFFLQYERELHKRSRLQFYHKNYAIIDAGDGNKRLWHSWTGLRIPLYGGIVGSAEYEIDYDSQPALRREGTDTTFQLKLGYQW